MPLTDDEIMATLAYKIIVQFKTCKDIRISVKGEYWERLPELRGRRLEGVCLGWNKKQAPDLSIRVQWEDGTDVEHLDQLFHPDVDLTFLPYENGRPAPRLTGRAAARLQREEAAEEAREKVIIDYEDGGQPKQQVWEVLPPDAITVDQRTEDFEEPKLNRANNTINTPYKMWQNAALPMSLVSKMVTFFNQRLDACKDDYYHRKTTAGEIIRFFGYMGALSIEKGCE